MNSLARVMKADITIPDQLYSWDISYSGINYPWTVLLSLPIPRYFQTKVLGWKVYEEENSALAGEVLRDLCYRESTLF